MKNAQFRIPGVQSVFVLVLVMGAIPRNDGKSIDNGTMGLGYEEYIVEHEISTTTARNSALSLHPDDFEPPIGCSTCTPQEMRYCLGSDLVKDHCCCDRAFQESLPFIPHTCYIGTTLCKPVIGDCALYSRLKKCCCDKAVLLYCNCREEEIVCNQNCNPVVPDCGTFKSVIGTESVRSTVIGT